MGLISVRNGTPVGLDVGTNTLRAVQVASGRPGPTLVKCGTIDVPAGAVVDGEVIDVEATAQALGRLWRSENFSTKRVVLGLANQKVIVRLIELPHMEGEELKGAIRYQAQDFIPIPVEEAIIDYQVLREFVDEDQDERKIEVLLVAAQKDMINQAVAMVTRAGLTPDAIEVSSLALVRSLLPEVPVVPSEEELSNGDKAIALINIASGTTNIVVVEDHLPRFSRVSTFGGNAFTEAVADRLNMPFDEAEELKMNTGLPPVGKKQSNGMKNHKDEVEKCHEVLGREVTKFVAEVRRSLDYYLSQVRQAKGITRVVLSGGASRLKNLADYLHEELQLTIESGHPLDRVTVGGELSEDSVREQELSLAISLGLAFREVSK